MLALDGCTEENSSGAEEVEENDGQACRLFTAPRRLA
jgi:hypothetical protein